MANVANTADPTNLRPTPTNSIRGGMVTGMRSAFGTMRTDGMQAGLNEFRSTVASTNEALKTTTATRIAAGDAGRIGGGLGRAGLGAAASGAGAIGSGLAAMGPQMAIMGVMMGGMALWSRHKKDQAEEKASDEAFGQSSTTRSMDALNQSFGRATGTTMKMADAAERAATKLDKIRTPTSSADARTVTTADIADGRRGKASNAFGGNIAEVTSQINTMTAGPMSNDDLQAVKIDLLRSGHSPADVEKIIGGVDAGSGPMSQRDIKNTLNPISESARKGKFGGDQKQMLGRLTENANETWQRNRERYGDEYANNQRRKTFNTIMATATDPNDDHYHSAVVLNQLARNLNTELPKNAQFSTDAGDLRSGKGTSIPTSDVVRPNLQAGDIYTSLVTGDNKLRGGSTISRAADLRFADPDKGSMFDQLKPGSAKSINDAIKSLLDGSKKAGQSLADFSDEANSAAANLPQDTPEAQVLQAASQRAFYNDQQMQSSSGTALGMRIVHNLNAGNIVTDSPEREAQRQSDAQAAVDDINNVKSQMQQRLMAQMQYQIQSSRSRQDFQTQTERSEADFNKGRVRTLRDFAKSIRRQAEDAAHAMYDPYKRIGVEALWDSDSLIQNLKDQQKALDEQIGNLSKLRGLGLSNQTIQQLGLADSSHAQEAAELVNNLMNDPKAVATLNAQIKQRVKSSGVLNQDSGNVSSARQREDFQQQLTDQNVDFATAQSRANADFKKGMSRAAQDLHTAQLQMTGDFTKLQSAMDSMMHGETVDFTNLMSNTLDDAISLVQTKGLTMQQALTQALTETLTPTGAPASGYSATNLSGGTSGGGYGDVGVAVTKNTTAAGAGRNDPDARGTTTTKTTFVNPGTGTVYSGGTSGSGRTTDYRPTDQFMHDHPANPGYNRQIGHQMAARMGWGGPEEWNALLNLWNGESGWNQYSDNPSSSAYGIPQALPGDKMGAAGKDWRTNPATQIAWGLNYIKGRYHTPSEALSQWKNRSPHWYGDGSIFQSPKVIGVGERGPEAVIPLNNAGTDVLAKAMGRAMTNTQARTVATAGARTHISYNTMTHVTDNRVMIEKAELAPPNLDSLAEQLRAKQRSTNLTNTQTRRKS
jgi:hypothetical protein